MGNLITETPYSEVTATMELLDRLGIGRDDLKRFRKSSTRVKAEVAKLIKGQGTDANVIDCDADPFVPDGWTVEEHKKGGQLDFNPANLRFYLAAGQKNGKSMQGHKLRKDLAHMSVMNANVLDYLLANPDLIPEDWKNQEGGNTRYIFFWGTIYRYSDGDLCVRCLYWDDGRWGWGTIGSTTTGTATAPLRCPQVELWILSLGSSRILTLCPLTPRYYSAGSFALLYSKMAVGAYAI